MTIDGSNRYVRVLTIAGSDSGGGAGIQADLKTFKALGCYGMSAITALTAQNTVGVQSVLPVTPDFVRAQIDSVLDDIGADAIKIGMLYSKPIIEAVGEALNNYGTIPLVLDPVMISTSGDRLLEESAVQAMIDVFKGLATIITPNLPEAEAMLGSTIETPSQLQAAAQELCKSGWQAVLVKGGHLRSGKKVCDVLATTNKKTLEIFHEKIDTKNTHGTGCTLSAAIASGLAKGHSLEQSVQDAEEYLNRALIKGSKFTLGAGNGPVGP